MFLYNLLLMFFFVSLCLISDDYPTHGITLQENSLLLTLERISVPCNDGPF